MYAAVKQLVSAYAGQSMVSSFSHSRSLYAPIFVSLQVLQDLTVPVEYSDRTSSFVLESLHPSSWQTVLQSLNWTDNYLKQKKIKAYLKPYLVAIF